MVAKEGSTKIFLTLRAGVLVLGHGHISYTCVVKMHHFFKNLFLYYYYSGGGFLQTKCVVMMTKKESTCTKI